LRTTIKTSWQLKQNEIEFKLQIWGKVRSYQG